MSYAVIKCYNRNESYCNGYQIGLVAMQEKEGSYMKGEIGE